MGVLTRWTGQGFMDGLFFIFPTLLWLSVGRRTTTGQRQRALSLTFIGEGAASFFRRGHHSIAGFDTPRRIPNSSAIVCSPFDHPGAH